jgi:riboflavin synthase
MGMFTGIIEEVGEVVKVERKGMAALLAIRTSFARELRSGDSVSVNGVCLTVLAVQPPTFWVEAVEETIARTNLGFLKAGDRVNLERALSASGRLGGHFVQGHVDGTGVIAQIVPRLRSKVMRIRCPQELMPYIVPKGSIAVDGVSLTVVEVGADWFTVSLIPFTLEHTTLGLRKVGDVVNLEVDILAKYVRHLLQGWADADRDAALKQLLAE